jgi:hypothetical protein
MRIRQRIAHLVHIGHARCHRGHRRGQGLGGDDPLGAHLRCGGFLAHQDDGFESTGALIGRRFDEHLVDIGRCGVEFQRGIGCGGIVLGFGRGRRWLRRLRRLLRRARLGVRPRAVLAGAGRVIRQRRQRIEYVVAASATDIALRRAQVGCGDSEPQVAFGADGEHTGVRSYVRRTACSATQPSRTAIGLVSNHAS